MQTIHALCTRLLQQFPFEANVPARFAVLDDRDQNEMMERANLGVFLEASRNPDSATGRALMTAMASAADVTFKDVVREACLSRDHFMAWTDAAGSAHAAAAQISAALGVDPDDRIEDVERDIVDGPNLPRVALAGHRPGSGHRQQDRSGPGGAAARGAGVYRRGAGRRVSRRIPHRSRSHAAQIGGDEEILRQQSGHRPADSNRKPAASCP